MPRDPSRRYHDRVARQYDSMYDNPYWHFHDELTWRTVKPHLPREATAACLDLGTGTGKWGLKLLKSGYPTTFVDHSGSMIEKVRDKLESNPRAKKATLMVGDIISLPDLPSDHFALTVAMGDPLSICTAAKPRAAASSAANLIDPVPPHPPPETPA
jgi:ubiquinone/menaquinone biosynthesis C-methylase UbiE